eukprot:375469_1
MDTNTTNSVENDETKSNRLFSPTATNTETAPSPQPNQSNKTYKNRIRTICEVKSYLEHFIPKLTTQTVVTCLIIKPILIFINVFFIGYQFFWFLFSSDPFGTGVPSKWNRILQIVIVSFEFFGLIILILMACIAAYTNYFSVMTDCIRLMGNWSVFRLFYRLRPLALFEYLSVMITHNAVRVEKNSSKIEKWKRIVNQLDIEIEHCPTYNYIQSNLFGIDVPTMKQTKSNLLRLIDIQNKMHSPNMKQFNNKTALSSNNYNLAS